MADSTVLYGPASCSTGCDGPIELDACATAPFYVTDKPIMLRAYGLTGTEEFIVEMVGGCGDGEFFERYVSACDCPNVLNVGNTSLMLPISGRYRLNACASAPLGADVLVEYAEIETDISIVLSGDEACGSKVTVTSNANGSTTIVVDGAATIIPAGTAVSVVDNGSTVILTVNGVPFTIDKGPDTAAEILALLGWTDCAGAPLTTGEQIATCAELTATVNAAIAAHAANAIMDGDAAGGALNGTYPNPGLVPVAVATALSFDDCAGAPIGVNAQLATCADLTAAINALPAEKFVVSGVFDRPTGDLTLTHNTATTVVVNLGLPDPDAAATVRGWVNLVSMQRLGDGDKRINNVRVGTGATGTNDSTVLGLNAGGAQTGIGLSAVGHLTGADNTGFVVTAMGYRTGERNTGANLAAYGAYAAQDNTGGQVTAIGGGAGTMNTGQFATLLGYQAGEFNNADTITALGYLAGRNNTGGAVTIVGGNAGQDNTGTAATIVGSSAGQNNTGADVTIVGFNAGPNNTFANVGLFGSGALPTAANEITLGNLAVTAVRSSGTFFGAAFTVVSDARNKDNVQDVDGKLAAEFSRRVKFSTFDLMTSFAAIDRALADHLLSVAKHRASTKAERRAAADALALAKKDGTPEAPPVQERIEPVFEDIQRVRIAEQAGVIAQEIQALTAELGAFGFIVKENAGGELSVDYTALFAVLMAGMQFRMNAAGI